MAKSGEKWGKVVESGKKLEKVGKVGKVGKSEEKWGKWRKRGDLWGFVVVCG